MTVFFRFPLGGYFYYRVSEYSANLNIFAPRIGRNWWSATIFDRRRGAHFPSCEAFSARRTT